MRILALWAIQLFSVCTCVGQTQWMVNPSIFTPGPAGTFDETAVKDPSIVFFDGNWHLFYTSRGLGEYQMAYAASSLNELNKAKRTVLKQLRGEKSSYAAAPQVFYFQPQKTWYLIYQTTDTNYQPVYSTTQTIENPQSWTAPKPVVQKNEKAKWIDFWVICNDTTAFLFYTRSHWDVYVQTTALKDFPDGFGNPQKVFSGVHEAIHVYKVKDKPEYHMFYELNIDKERNFGLAKANHLAGPWEKVTDYYATGSQLKYPENAEVWTEEVSHGELIRSGYDQRLEYDADKPQYLIQGILKRDHHGPYPELVWKLGVIEKKTESKNASGEKIK